MPLDHSRRFDKYQGFEDLRPHSVKPDPQEPVGGGAEECEEALSFEPQRTRGVRYKVLKRELGAWTKKLLTQ
jgi:hypothetical protein